LTGGARNPAVCRAAAAAVAIRRLQLTKGRLPGELDELVPDYLGAVPKDPYNGHPLHYALRDGEIIIYSVGRNLVDDGGLDEGGHGDPDVVFVLRTTSD
jgi:hypothetical protein